jgi:hypothetical protein
MTRMAAPEAHVGQGRGEGERRGMRDESARIARVCVSETTTIAIMAEMARWRDLTKKKKKRMNRSG